MIKASELRRREVVSVDDGKRLGFVSDLELDPREGCINAIIVPGPGKFFGLLGGERDYVIPWDKIVKLGSDVILVEVPGMNRKVQRTHKSTR
ncbi:YlmC/YmxH family sporulation protein [Natranaerobius thermophilus]|uniref:Sporulation protein, YlmC/YmxH family n=1 Tax=Natranaerobius thermophilus (strain ATCC BAA-1301 / DSM 18059 / JW/NM-WN-LF) TaxID=457570 RepID=B2A2I0_NATTJ|nr:YlmC/YmxH family sporulation protein [Natranaerobius thermophilus]ACB84895.1 sporulation protein, YlmC/YmxH family [Natranaerobius thermophilus JW/NM-WN-LF]